MGNQMKMKTKIIISQSFFFTILTWIILLIVLSKFIGTDDFSLTTVRLVFIILPFFTVPILVVGSMKLIHSHEIEKKGEIAELKEKTITHRSALIRNLQKALKYDDYGRLISNKQSLVLTEFLDSVGYKKHLLKRKKAEIIIMKTLEE